MQNDKDFFDPLQSPPPLLSDPFNTINLNTNDAVNTEDDNMSVRGDEISSIAHDAANIMQSSAKDDTSHHARASVGVNDLSREPMLQENTTPGARRSFADATRDSTDRQNVDPLLEAKRKIFPMLKDNVEAKDVVRSFLSFYRPCGKDSVDVRTFMARKVAPAIAPESQSPNSVYYDFTGFKDLSQAQFLVKVMTTLAAENPVGIQWKAERKAIVAFADRFGRNAALDNAIMHNNREIPMQATYFTRSKPVLFSLSNIPISHNITNTLNLIVDYFSEIGEVLDVQMECYPTLGMVTENARVLVQPGPEYDPITMPKVWCTEIGAFFPGVVHEIDMEFQHGRHFCRLCRNYTNHLGGKCPILIEQEQRWAECKQKKHHAQQQNGNGIAIVHAPVQQTQKQGKMKEQKQGKSVQQTKERQALKSIWETQGNRYAVLHDLSDDDIPAPKPAPKKHSRRHSHKKAKSVGGLVAIIEGGSGSDGDGAYLRKAPVANRNNGCPSPLTFSTPAVKRTLFPMSGVALVARDPVNPFLESRATLSSTPAFTFPHPSTLTLPANASLDQQQPENNQSHPMESQNTSCSMAVEVEGSR